MAVTFLWFPVRLTFTSSIFRMKKPRMPRMTSMNAPIFAAEDMVLFYPPAASGSMPARSSILTSRARGNPTTFV